MLHRPLVSQREPRLGSTALNQQFGHVLAQCRAVLEAVSRATAHQPNVLELGMAINQEIAVGSVFVLADASFDDRRVAQFGKTPRHIVANFPEGLIAHYAHAAFGIKFRSVSIECNLEAAALE